MNKNELWKRHFPHLSPKEASVEIEKMLSECEEE